MRELRHDDIAPLTELLNRTGAFRPEEIAVALELLQIVLDDPEQKDYAVGVSEVAGRVAGYVLFGPVPLTSGNYDIYWIAVDPDVQGHGIGQKLMRHVEEAARADSGRMVCLETSSQDGYSRTRAFYERAGYTEESCIRDFYQPGDHRITYVKRLAS